MRGKKVEEYKKEKEGNDGIEKLEREIRGEGGASRTNARMRRRATTCARDRNDIFEHFFNSNPKNKSKEHKKHDEGEKNNVFPNEKRKDPENK